MEGQKFPEFKQITTYHTAQPQIALSVYPPAYLISQHTEHYKYCWPYNCKDKHGR